MHSTSPLFLLSAVDDWISTFRDATRRRLTPASGMPFTDNTDTDDDAFCHRHFYLRLASGPAKSEPKILPAK